MQGDGAVAVVSEVEQHLDIAWLVPHSARAGGDPHNLGERDRSQDLSELRVRPDVLLRDRELISLLEGHRFLLHSASSIGSHNANTSIGGIGTIGG